MASTLATFDFAMKERYTKQVVENLVFADRPLLGNVKKDTEFQGLGHPVPLIYRAPLGVAVTLADAQSNASGTAGNIKGAQFLVTAGDVSGSVDIGDKVMLASRANPGAFLQNKVAETDGLYGEMSDKLAIALAGNGGQSIGRVTAAGWAATVATLTNPADTMNVEVGMVLEASANDGSSTAHALLAGTAVVEAVDRNLGTVDIDATPGAWGANNYLFQRGTFYGNTTKFIMYGVTGYVWGDASPPTIYSQARTDDIQRLAGVRVPDADVAGLGIEQRIQILGSRLTGRGKGPGADEYYLHPEDWQTLAIALQGRGERALTDDRTSFGYQYLEVIAGGKKGKVFADRFWPKGVCGGLSMKSWTLLSMEELVHPLSGDGLTMLRKSTTNDYEYRLISYPGLGCNAPGWNGRVNVA